VAHCDERAVTGYPVNYTDGFQTNFGDFHPSVGSARRELTASSEDPGTFTLSANRGWVAATVAIRPAAAGGGSLSDLTIPLAAFGNPDNTTYAVWGASVGGITPEAELIVGAFQAARFNLLLTSYRAAVDTTPTASIDPAGNKLYGIAVELRAPTGGPVGSPPAAPSGVSMTLATFPTTFDCAWTNNGTGDGIRLEVAKNGGQFVQIAALGPSATTYQYVDPTAAIGDYYLLRVIAHNAYGESAAQMQTPVVVENPNPSQPGGPRYGSSTSYPSTVVNRPPDYGSGSRSWDRN